MAKQLRKIAYVPYEIEANRFHQVMRDCLMDLGYEVCDDTAKDMDAVIYSWYESVEGKTIFRALYHFLWKEMKIRWLTVRGCRIVCVFHNKYPHGLRGYNRFLSMRFTKDLYKRAAKIIVMTEDAKRYLGEYLSEDEIRKKAFLVPHVGYRQLYENFQRADDVQLQMELQRDFRLLFFGLLKPYKGIEVIFEAAKRCADLPIRFIVCGKSFDPTYERELAQQAEAIANVEWNPGFIPEEEIGDRILSADAVMLPYDTSSTLNSGAIMHAFSVGRTVISPMISTLTDFDPELYYTYDSQSDRRVESFVGAILRAYEDFRKDPDRFFEKGRQLSQQVERERSVDIILERYRILMQELDAMHDPLGLNENG